MTKVILALFLTACSFGGDVPVGSEFSLKKNESATVKGAAIAIKVISAGTSQHVSGGDSVFCKVEVIAEGKTETVEIDVGEGLRRARHEIKVTRVDLKADSKLADPWSNISCGFVVTRAEK